MNEDTERPGRGGRDQVLELLRATGSPIGVRDLCDQTGLSANTIRFHLRNLERVGSVRATPNDAHQGPGRPPLQFRAQPVEAVDAGAAYRLLAGLLADELSRSSPGGLSPHAGRSWARRALSNLHPDRAAAEPMWLLVEVLRDAGFDPVVDQAVRTVALHRCPFRDLAAEQPEVVCGMHLALLTGLLEEIGTATEVRMIPVLDDSDPCLVRVGPSRRTRLVHPTSRTTIKEERT